MKKVISGVLMIGLLAGECSAVTRGPTLAEARAMGGPDTWGPFGLAAGFGFSFFNTLLAACRYLVP